MNRLLHLHEFSLWLNGTGIHNLAKSWTDWSLRVLLGFQITHVLAICLIIGSAGIFSLRMAGLAPVSQSLGDTARRLLPWAWGAILLAAFTGSFMVIERPNRAFDSLTFPYKMMMLIVALTIMGIFTVTTFRDPGYWDTGRRNTGRVLGAVAVVLWIGIIFAGRWIAYGRAA